MVRTTLSFRIAPPLYGVHAATLSLRDVAGLDEVTVTVTLVDSGAPTIGQIVTSGGGSVAMPGDNLGVLHNTRLDVIVPGAVSDWMDKDTGVALAHVANRLIDWYRFTANQPFVRRIPLRSVGGFEARDDRGGHGQSFLGWQPGESSTTAGDADTALVARLESVLRTRHELPIWASLFLDARADWAAGDLPTAVLLVNASLETLVNRAFRAVASDQDVASAFTESGTADAEADPWTIWRLTTRLNAIVDFGMSNTELRDRIKDVNQYRNDVSHGNPVELASDQVKKSVDALGELGSIVDRKVVEHLSPA